MSVPGATSNTKVNNTVVDLNGTDSSDTQISSVQTRMSNLLGVTPSVTLSVRQGRDYIWLENQKRQGRLHSNWALKNRPNLGSQRWKRKRIPDIGISVSQSPKEGKPRLVTVGVKDWGEKKS